MTSPSVETERYIRTGQHDALFAVWPGRGLPDRARHGSSVLRGALVAEVRARTSHATAPEALADLDIVAFTRGKVEPMVRGLFPLTERQAVLDMLARSVVFLTPATIAQVLNETQFLNTAWRLANAYLLSCGAKLLADDAPRIVGLSAATTCYVSMDYFRRFCRYDDFLIHEAAHVFHNCKRVTVGLPETRRREWLLDIAFRKRETFAYACETYSRIVVLADGTAARRNALIEVGAGPMPADDSVDADEYLAIVREAISARNGWKRILDACAPPRRRPVSTRDCPA